MKLRMNAETRIVRVNPFIELAKVKAIWLKLSEQCQPSFFNSWGWVDTWLACLPKTTSIEFIVHFENNIPICCYFLGIKSTVENKVFFKKRVYLNSTGYEEFDNLTIEYNAPLIANYAKLDEIKLFSELKDIEEFHLPISTLVYNSMNNKIFSRIESLPSYWIDLNKVRENDNDYISLISKNKRSQIKRSIKEYQLGGEIKIKVAGSKEEALQMLDELAELHQKEWTQRGKPGAFLNQFFCEFHHKLIQDRFEQGEIQLLKIFNNEAVIGYLYNFIYNDEVLFYQCGFNYKEGNIYRPGIVSHYFAILFNCQLNNKKYNFLVGKSQYKKSLSTDFDTLNSIVLCRKNLKSHFEYLLRKIKIKELK